LTYLSPYSSYIHKSKYARWIESEGRRETWDETVDRFVDYMEYRFPGVAMGDIRTAVRNMDVMPSMRMMFAAGPAHEREEISGYNCATVAVSSLRAFDEAVYILMNGTGLGFSVEQEYVDQLPTVPSAFRSGDEIVVGDSKEGWSRAYRKLIEELFAGRIPTWDLAQLRPAGAPLKTFGGTSSGPEPLDKLFTETVGMVYGSRGRQLTAMECHELMCMIGSIIVAGGVRRSALISLSDLDNEEIRDAKHGSFWNDKPHLALANNSVSYKSKPTRQQFDAEFNALIASGSGERGIFSRYGAQSRDNGLDRDMTKVVSTNPCGEIMLRNQQFCNLSEVIVKEGDTEADILHKLAIASKLGTLQSSFTNFNEIRDEWRANTEEERLLGVSLTGIMGNHLTAAPSVEFLQGMKKVVHDANRYWASELGIPMSKAMTTVKPSGTVSQLAGVSSGIHPWHSKFYRRNVRSSKNEALTDVLLNQGVPHEIDAYDPNNYVFSFAVAAPEGAILREDISAIEQLEHWLLYSTHYTDHNPSVTINVENDEWEQVREFVWEHFDMMVGVSFLPSENVYVQAPFQEVDEDMYQMLVDQSPNSLYWEALHEAEDHTSGAQELACVASEGGFCEI